LIFSQIVANFPDFAEGWNKRATLYYLVGNTDASIEDIKKTLELEPRHFGALSGLGLVYLQQGKLALAEEAFQQLITVHPNSPSAQENLRLVKEQRTVNVI
jgi:Flp pilus assembly protein TadD